MLIDARQQQVSPSGLVTFALRHVFAIPLWLAPAFTSESLQKHALALTSR